MQPLSVQDDIDILEMRAPHPHPNVVARALGKDIAEVMKMPNKEYRKCLALALAENGLDE